MKSAQVGLLASGAASTLTALAHPLTTSVADAAMQISSLGFRRVALTQILYQFSVDWSRPYTPRGETNVKVHHVSI